MGALVMEERQAALDGLPRVRFAGPLTAATASTLRARVRQALGSGEAGLVVDLQAVTALDAAGIAALLDARRSLRAQAGGTLVLRANAIVCRALKESGTISAFALSSGTGM
jgi:anti-sigma B factor antagonist